MAVRADPRRYNNPHVTQARAEDIPAPADAVLIAAPMRPWLAGFCTRCDRAAMVPFGGPDGLCGLCKAAEVVDLAARPVAPVRVARSRR